MPLPQQARRAWWARRNTRRVVKRAVAPRVHETRGATTVRAVRLTGYFDLVDVHLLEEVDRHVRDLLGVAEHVLPETDRDDRHVGGEDVLGVLPLLDRLGRSLGLRALLDQAVEGGVAVAV